jgi:hypothetical protein
MSNGRVALRWATCMQAEREEMRNQLKGYAEDGESDVGSDGEDSSTLTPNSKLKKKKARHATGTCARFSSVPRSWPMRWLSAMLLLCRCLCAACFVVSVLCVCVGGVHTALGCHPASRVVQFPLRKVLLRFPSNSMRSNRTTGRRRRPRRRCCRCV